MGKKAYLVAGGSLAAAAAMLNRRDRDGALSADQFAQRQQLRAQVMRRRGKSTLKAATSDLVLAGRETIVLEHIHPRWLRQEVDRRLAAGETITEERIEQLRALRAGRV